MVSTKYTEQMLSNPPTLNEKINVFEDRVIGWQLRIAEVILNGDPIVGSRPSPHADFAALTAVVSYFEMIAQFDAMNRASVIRTLE